MDTTLPEQQHRQPLLPLHPTNPSSETHFSSRGGYRGRGGNNRQNPRRHQPFQPPNPTQQNRPRFPVRNNPRSDFEYYQQGYENSGYNGQPHRYSNNGYQGNPSSRNAQPRQRVQHYPTGSGQLTDDVRGYISENSRARDQQVENKSNLAVRVPGNRGGRVQKNEDKNQRERLIEDLASNKLECQFCCDKIWSKQAIWSCEECYNIFHLTCLRKWASSCKRESEDSTWRCMICQFVYLEEPKASMCFCRKKENPDFHPQQTPHSCGEICGKGSSKGNAGQGCEHPCICLCHPGPCPPCQRLVTRTCGCGKVKAQEQCSSSSVLVCSNICEKMLDCGNHKCQQTCHTGSCSPCPVTVDKFCYCGVHSKLVSCRLSVGNEFSCGEVCDRKLECGNHVCGKKCHAGACGPCSRDPGLVTRCPCRKHPLMTQRKSCLDEIPGCGEICGKMLMSCGSEKKRHFCESDCHDGECPACHKRTEVNCACRASTKVVNCVDIGPEVLNWRCEKRCGKKMMCGRHKCENICCNFDEHVCLKVCGKKLGCGLHNCQDPCGHFGACRRCYNTDFQERTCNCGFTVQLPPIPCGAPLPDCPKPCSLNHPCGHPPTHLCHGDAHCPPCTFLCERRCFGDHESRRNVPCHIGGVSCGKLCGMQLPCGVHSCRKVCHAGACQTENEKCQQACTLVTRKCGHQCGASCHGQSKCPVTLCKAPVEVTCECKLRKMKVVCHQHDTLLKEYLKRKDVPLKDVKIDDFRFAMPTDVLECDDECRRVDRNAKLAGALNIGENEPAVDGDVAGPPVYTETLRQYCRDNLRWATRIEESIISLIESLKETRSKRRVHQFQPMYHEQRKYLRDLAGYYGCETQSYDHEPLRTVSLIAKTESVLLPTTPLYKLIAAERPARQVALCPIKTSSLAQEKVQPTEKARSWPKEVPKFEPERNRFNAIDYFDVTD